MKKNLFRVLYVCLTILVLVFATNIVYASHAAFFTSSDRSFTAKDTYILKDTLTRSSGYTTKKSSKDTLKGATGYAVKNLPLQKKADKHAKKIAVVKGGQPFRIQKETGKWWRISYSGKKGYVRHCFCMVNLADLRSDIVFHITNASGSIFTSSGKPLSIYGKKLYAAGKVENAHIGRKEYIVPLLYSTAKKVIKAQKMALKDGYCLKIYDSYRPHSVSIKMRTSLQKLYSADETVRKNIDERDGSIWGEGWFLAGNVSAHNTGSAIDVSLVDTKAKTEITDMPSPMHELSTAALKYRSPQCPSVAAGRTASAADYIESMTGPAILLDRYFAAAGMNSLASEWWHFQETKAHKRILKVLPQGMDFQVKKTA